MFERVKLSDDGVEDFPDLAGQVGTIVDEKRLRAWWGECYIVKFKPGGKSIWAFLGDPDLVRV